MDQLFERIAQLRAHGEEAVLVTVVEREGSVPGVLGAKMLVTADGHTLGTVGGGELEYQATAQALQVLQQRQSKLVRYSLMEGGKASNAEPLGAVCGGQAALFFDYLGYAAHICILGAGHVGRAIARHLKDMRLFVTIVDHRPEMGEGIEGANRVIIGDYAAVLANNPLPAGAYYLIVTPSHAYDYETLRQIMASDCKPRYVGVLGSRSKAESMLARLAEELGAERIDWSVIHCPVGLEIGGPSPDANAIAIIAEMQALRYGKTGHKHMRISAIPGLRNPQDQEHQ